MLQSLFLLQYLCAFVSLDYCCCLFLVLPVLAEVLHLLLGVGDDGVAAGLPAGRANLAMLVGVLRKNISLNEFAVIFCFLCLDL